MGNSRSSSSSSANHERSDCSVRSGAQNGVNTSLPVPTPSLSHPLPPYDHLAALSTRSAFSSSIQLVDLTDGSVLRSFSPPPRCELFRIYTFPRGGGDDHDDLRFWSTSVSGDILHVDLKSSRLISSYRISEKSIGLAMTQNPDTFVTSTEDPSSLVVWNSVDGEILGRLRATLGSVGRLDDSVLFSHRTFFPRRVFSAKTTVAQWDLTKECLLDTSSPPRAQSDATMAQMRLIENQQILLSSFLSRTMSICGWDPRVSLRTPSLRILQSIAMPLEIDVLSNGFEVASGLGGGKIQINDIRKPNAWFTCLQTLFPRSGYALSSCSFSHEGKSRSSLLCSGGSQIALFTSASSLDRKEWVQECGVGRAGVSCCVWMGSGRERWELVEERRCEEERFGFAVAFWDVGRVWVNGWAVGMLKVGSGLEGREKEREVGLCVWKSFLDSG